MKDRYKVHDSNGYQFVTLPRWLMKTLGMADNAECVRFSVDFDDNGPFGKIVPAKYDRPGEN
ncbi:hypothetical protein LI82_05000 [Methanococcoides methylutens]|uniref:Uncharacterized protein n=1 Tax=Methanococcoides methylutens TaxID=2226 RepID=A0A099T381_METMT|nr:hypothetical protein [Methanococcoides methylutens]KGK99364.1 hypothetical protein LI82_05000 [Methanococcoides methylutens]